MKVIWWVVFIVMIVVGGEKLSIASSVDESNTNNEIRLLQYDKTISDWKLLKQEQRELLLKSFGLDTSFLQECFNDFAIIPNSSNIILRDLANFCDTLLIKIALNTMSAFPFMADTVQSLSHVDEDVAGIVTGVRLLYNSQLTFEGVDDAEPGKPAGNTALVLLGFGNDENIYRNPFGGNYMLNVNPDNNQQFIISLDGLSARDCRSLLEDHKWPGSVGGATGKCMDMTNNNVIHIMFDKDENRQYRQPETKHITDQDGA